MEAVKTITLNLLEPIRAKRERLRELRKVYHRSLCYVIAKAKPEDRMRRTRL